MSNREIEKEKAVRRTLWIVGLSLAVPAVAAAQGVPRFEVFGGYSYGSLRADVADESLFGAGSGVVAFPRFGSNGWTGSVAVNATSWFAVVADVGGLYATPTRTIGATPVTIDMHEHNYLFGPRFSGRFGRWTLFGHGLFGEGHASVSIVIPEVLTPIRIVNTELAMAAGVGVDLHGVQQKAPSQGCRSRTCRSPRANGLAEDELPGQPPEQHLALGRARVSGFDIALRAWLSGLDRLGTGTVSAAVGGRRGEDERTVNAGKAGRRGGSAVHVADRVSWRQRFGRRRWKSDTRYYADAFRLQGARAARWDTHPGERSHREIRGEYEQRHADRHWAAGGPAGTVRPAWKRLGGNRYVGGERRCALGYVPGTFTTATQLTIDANTDTVNGPAELAIAPAARMTVTLGGYGVTFVTLHP